MTNSYEDMAQELINDISRNLRMEKVKRYRAYRTTDGELREELVIATAPGVDIVITREIPPGATVT